MEYVQDKEASWVLCNLEGTRLIISAIECFDGKSSSAYLQTYEISEEFKYFMISMIKTILIQYRYELYTKEIIQEIIDNLTRFTKEILELKSIDHDGVFVMLQPTNRQIDLGTVKGYISIALGKCSLVYAYEFSCIERGVYVEEMIDQFPDVEE